MTHPMRPPNPTVTLLLRLMLLGIVTGLVWRPLYQVDPAIAIGLVSFFGAIGIVASLVLYRQEAQQ